MMVGSDGSGRTAPDGPLARGGVHPRGSGTFPKVFNDYVRTSPILTLEEFVRRCTSLSAKRLSLKSRGMLRPGYFADIVVFDPDQYRDHATYETSQARDRRRPRARQWRDNLLRWRLDWGSGGSSAPWPGLAARLNTVTAFTEVFFVEGRWP
jgi:hypothetical protein